MELFLVILGIACIVYCTGIMLFISHSNRFYLIWGLLGSLLLIVGTNYTWFINQLPDVWKEILVVSISVIIFLFILVEGMVISGFVKKCPKNLSHIIILGAQLKEKGPSYSLQMRLDKACEYLTANKGTKVIVSGGRGSNEPYSEAQGMYEYLVVHGISSDRIHKEDQSKSTHQNLVFSSKYIDKDKDTVGIVTSNFHVFRAIHLAKAAGYRSVYGIAAKAYVPLLPNNMLREFVCIIKDFIFGNLI